MKFLLTKKLGMTQVFDEDGKMIPVTLVKVELNRIIRIKTQDKDGYSAYVVGVGLKDEKREGKKAIDFKKVLEFLIPEGNAEFEEGKEINSDLFEKGDKVKITGISKGKGFQGVVKRHGFKGGPKSHGHKHNLRQPGSIGSTFPMRVIKGKRMAGRMGSDQITLRGIKIVDVVKEDQIIALKGAIPGRPGGWIKIVGF